MTGTDGISSLGKMLGSLNVNDAKTTRTTAANAAPQSAMNGMLAGRLTHTGDHASLAQRAAWSRRRRPSRMCDWRRWRSYNRRLRAATIRWLRATLRTSSSPAC